MDSMLEELPGWFALQAALENAPDPILMVDGQRMIRFANRQAMSLFVHAREVMVGQPVEMLIPPDRRDRHAAFFDAWFDNPQPREMGKASNIEGYSHRGKNLPISIELQPVEIGGHIFAMAWIKRKGEAS